MMTKSKGIRAATKQADFFNTGYSPAFHNELRSGLSKDDKKEIEKQSYTPSHLGRCCFFFVVTKGNRQN
jgi:hypothetical protein